MLRVDHQTLLQTDSCYKLSLHHQFAQRIAVIIINMKGDEEGTETKKKKQAYFFSYKIQLTYPKRNIENEYLRYSIK